MSSTLIGDPMKNMLNRVFPLLLLAFAGGCSSSQPMVPVSISPTAAAVAPGRSVRFTASGGNASQFVWSVNGIQGGNSNAGTVDSQGNYAAPAGQTSLMATVTVSTSTNPTSSSSASVAVIAPGQVTPTANPQVAMYTISPPTDASVSIQFSADTNYGLKTWTQPAPTGGGLVSIFVAGMRASTPYHMRAVVQLSNGLQFTDSDHVFTTGGLQPTQLPTLTATTTTGMSPQSGVEMLDLMFGNSVPVVVSDLAGNVIWTYNPSGGTGADLIQPIKMLPNGHFLVVFSPVETSPPPAGTITVVREVDLAGTTIREISLDTLNTRLAAANYNLVATDIHHDILPLANGHWILIVSTTKQFTDLPGLPGTTTVIGDALVDLDANLNPVWVWSTFDHLDVNRHPMSFPDWTHSNAVLYSPDDGDLLLSMRHQNWIIKIDYKDGLGTGDIVWHLGEGGDFTLQNGTDPTDWFYAQHGPSLVTPNTSGTFSLAVFDNGNDREFPAGVNCGTSGAPPCGPYSTVPILQIDETAKTAALTFHDLLTPGFSVFGGNAEVLANGNVEFDMCAVSPAAVYEVTQETNPQTVWQMTIGSNYAYRAFRMPSLYPGVQW